jgi:predicted transposase/invertase (TIGR01784 family)
MYNDYYNTLDFAVEKGMKKGMEEGMEKGLQKGLEEGLQKGLQKGKAEGRQEEKHSIALNLKKLGVSIEQIAFATSLSIEEIEKL